jgi:hypothetical protein
MSLTMDSSEVQKEILVKNLHGATVEEDHWFLINEFYLVKTLLARWWSDQLGSLQTQVGIRKQNEVLVTKFTMELL